MKKFLYVCEADSGGIMEYAIRQSAAIAQEGVEVHFLCKPSFPAERLAKGIKGENLKSGKAETLKNVRGLAGKLHRASNMIAGLRSGACDLQREISLGERRAERSHFRTKAGAGFFRLRAVENSGRKIPAWCVCKTR